jgi:hypothetical protein
LAVFSNAGVATKWIIQKPRLLDYYMGIGMAEKKMPMTTNSALKVAFFLI